MPGPSRWGRTRPPNTCRTSTAGREPAPPRLLLPEVPGSEGGGSVPSAGPAFQPTSPSASRWVWAETDQAAGGVQRGPNCTPHATRPFFPVRPQRLRAARTPGQSWLRAQQVAPGPGRLGHGPWGRVQLDPAKRGLSAAGLMLVGRWGAGGGSRRARAGGGGAHLCALFSHSAGLLPEFTWTWVPGECFLSPMLSPIVPHGSSRTSRPAWMAMLTPQGWSQSRARAHCRPGTQLALDKCIDA